MKERRCLVLGLTLVLLAPVGALADQDIIVLDPSSGAAVWSQDGIANYLPGQPNYVRDDLLSLPPNMERVICYGDGSGSINVDRVRYLIDRGETDEFVEMVDDTGSTTGVQIRWKDTMITRPCDHTVAGSCWYTGIPPELFGTIVPTSLQYYAGGVWAGAGAGKVFKFMAKPTSNTTCQAF